MANNRMWLIHKPSKLGVMLGKRMAWGWYSAPDTEHLESFYKYLEQNPDPEGRQDDFVLAMEDCSGSSCFNEWVYTTDFIEGFRVFDFTPPKIGATPRD